MRFRSLACVLFFVLFGYTGNWEMYRFWRFSNVIHLETSRNTAFTHAHTPLQLLLAATAAAGVVAVPLIFVTIVCHQVQKVIAISVFSMDESVEDIS